MDDQNPQINSYYSNSAKPRRFLRFLILILVLGGIGYLIFGRGNSILVSNVRPSGSGAPEERSEEEFNPFPTADPRRLNVLILGIRGEQDLKDGGRLTDTMLVVSIDKKTGKTAMISVPRDLYINMLGVKGKINMAYEAGYSQGKGLEVTSEIVSRITGIHIDRAVIFDFLAFQKIVDQLGGVDVKLDKPFSESTQWGYSFSLPAGNNHLTGEQALYYVRSRYSTSDFDRARRQQQVITAIKNKAFTAGFLTNPSNVTGLLGDLNSHIKTNFQLWDIKDMVKLADSLSNSSVKTYVLSTDNLLYQTHTTGGEYILLPKSGNYKEIQSLFATILTEEQKTAQKKETPKP